MLVQLDVLTAQRSMGNHILPSIPRTLDRIELRDVFNAMHQSYDNRSPLSDEQIFIWKKALSPVLEIERWGRWLYLEHALQIASRSGDLLFSALLLRSMGEEMLRLLVLELPSDSEYLKFNDQNSARKAWLCGALVAVEPLIRSHQSAIAPYTPEYFSFALGEKASSSLKEVNKSLNDYVHQNFGSHVLAWFPEEASGITTILDAAVSIYSAFLSLKWAREAIGISGNRLPEVYLTQMPKLQWRIERYVLNKINDSLPISQSTDKLKVSSFFEWLRESDRLLEDNNKILINEDFLDNLKPLLSDGTDEKANNATATLIRSVEHHEFPLRYRGVSVLLNWSITRKADKFLVSRPSGLNKKHEVGSGEWLRFTAQALHLAISTSLLKLDLLIAQAAFQVSSKNPLGAVFCARSILEALASINWLFDRLEASWDEVVKQVQQGCFTEVKLKEIDNDLAVFLTGSKHSLEQHREWGESWSVSGKNHLGIIETVKKSFGDQADIRKIYDITSAMVHGRLMRGVEILSTETSSKNYWANLWRGIYVADLACNDIQMYLKGRAVRLGLRLKSLEYAIDRECPSPETLERATLSMDSLLPEKHFSGTGSKDEPIMFADGIPYYEAFYKYCSQLGLDINKRRIEQSGNVFLDTVQDGDKFIHFLIPQPVIWE